MKPARSTWTNLSRVDCSSGGPHQKPVAKPGADAARGAEAVLSKPTTSAKSARREAPASPAPLTEREGFEPSTHLSAGTRFPVAFLRPLGHLSKPSEANVAILFGMGKARGLDLAPARREAPAVSSTRGGLAEDSARHR